MKKQILLALLCFTGFAGSLQAVLPPLYHTSDQIIALLKDDQLGERLPSGEPIEAIINTQEGYMVITPKFFLPVKVVYLPREHSVGPARYQLEFGEPIVRSAEDMTPASPYAQ